jgi:hypothetical protein
VILDDQTYVLYWEKHCDWRYDGLHVWGNGSAGCHIEHAACICSVLYLYNHIMLRIYLLIASTLFIDLFIPFDSKVRGFKRGQRVICCNSQKPPTIPRQILQPGQLRVELPI